jgi:hypothetical protein
MMIPGENVAIKSRMGRKKRWHDVMGAKFPAGTFERIAALLGENEDRTDFVRWAVEREIERRQLAAKRGAGREPRRRSKR